MRRSARGRGPQTRRGTALGIRTREKQVVGSSRSENLAWFHSNGKSGRDNVGYGVRDGDSSEVTNARDCVERWMPVRMIVTSRGLE